MKIIHINCVYPVGSTGRIIENIVNECEKHGYESMILYGRGAKCNKVEAIKVSSEFEAKIHGLISRLTGQWFSYSPISTAKIIRILKNEKPDVVHLHCLNANFVNVYRLIDYLKKNQIKTVLTLHAEIMHTAGCEHAGDCMKWQIECQNCEKIKGKLTGYFRDDAKVAYSKIKKAFYRFDKLTITGVSEWLTQRAESSNVFKHNGIRFYTIHNAVDTSKFRQTILKKENHVPLILHVTPNFNHPLKGGKYVIDLARIHPEWNFLIVGSSCKNIPHPSNIRFIPHTNSQQELISYYKQADITLLTSYRETFSMVCLESLACGTPVVGFKAGAPELIFKGDFAEFVDFGNVEALAIGIRQMLKKRPKIDSDYIEQNFSVKHMVAEYLKVYEQ